MAEIGNILDDIDGVILDYETSGDAMRWVPPEERTEGKAATSGRFVVQHPPRRQRARDRLTVDRERQPEIQRSTINTRLVPFVGGPFHRDLRAVDRRYVEHRQTLEVMVPLMQGFDVSRMWIDDVEVTDHIAQIDFPETHRYRIAHYTLPAGSRVYVDVAYVSDTLDIVTPNPEANDLLIEAVIYALENSSWQPAWQPFWYPR